jgi:glycosyltransferase involved in cell wall biosynthesis
MIRILHLLDRDAEFEAERGSESIGRAVGEGFHVTRRTVGHGGDWRDPATAAAMLRRAREQFDVVHAWGGRALTVAALGGTAKSPVVFSPASATPLRTVQWLRAVMSYRRVEVVCPTSTMHRKLVERGVPLERCHLVRPGVEFNRIKRRRDPALRERLGLNDDDHVLLATGESTHAAAHRDAAWATTILHVADPKYKLLAWGRGTSVASVEHFGRNVMPDALRVAEQRLGRRVEFEELLPASDTIVVTARAPVTTLPIAIAMAAALPIVATVTPTVAELLEDRHTALMTAPGKPRLFARRVLDLIEDSSAQWTLSDMARTEAYEYFAFTRFVNQVRSVYRQVVDADRVEVQQPAPGAGMRFHGRT